MSFQVAIDGPAGAGKSTIAKRVAREIGLIYVDTGAMYRAVALYLIREGADLQNAEEIAEKCTGAKVEIRYQDGEQIVVLNGENVNPFLRTEEAGNAASQASANPAVRAHLLDLQKNLAEQNDCVMDGRDIGTVVLPGAQLKVFLTASSEVRARRRFDELTARGETPELAQIRADIERRDDQDMHREVSPLRKAPDAVLVDTSEMTIEEVTARICALAQERRNR